MEADAVSRWFIALLLPALFAADDEWTKVRQLKTGTELRIVKRKSSQPILAIMDEAGEDNLVAVIKNEQVSIPKDEIERIDYRPKQTGGRATKETKTTSTQEAPDARQGPPKATHGGGDSTSYSTNYSWGKPDFETVYRRKAAPPKPPVN